MDRIISIYSVQKHKQISFVFRPSLSSFCTTTSIFFLQTTLHFCPWSYQQPICIFCKGGGGSPPEKTMTLRVNIGNDILTTSSLEGDGGVSRLSARREGELALVVVGSSIVSTNRSEDGVANGHADTLRYPKPVDGTALVAVAGPTLARVDSCNRTNKGIK